MSNFSKLNRASSSGQRHFILAFGVNSQGALGIGDPMIDPVSPFLTPVLGLPPNSDPKFIACGMHHSLAVTADGKLFRWGRNEFLQGASKLAWEPTEVPFAGQIRRAFASGVANIIEDDQGGLWSFGVSRFGQLCLGPSVLKAPLPQRIAHPALAKESVRTISFGFGHALIVTKSGKVFGFGYNAMDGRGGFPDGVEPSSEPLPPTDSAELRQLQSQVQWTPRQIDIDALRRASGLDASTSKVIWAVAGLDHSSFLCSNGRIIIVGDNSLSQHGRLTAPGSAPLTVSSPDLPPISLIACGLGNTLAYSQASGQLFEWGGPGAPSPSTSKVRELPEFRREWKVEALASGRAHSVALVLDESGNRQAITWGSSAGGRLGRGDDRDERPGAVDLELAAEQIPELGPQTRLEPIQIAAGHDHTLVLVRTT